MKFSSLFHKSHQHNFDSIQGYDDIENIVRRALDSNDNYNLLLIGAPASSKILFLLGIMEQEPKAVLFDGTNSTNRILDVLEEQRPKIICLDEIDKLSKPFQEKLLMFLESGRVKVDMVKRSYDFTIPGAKVFATANDINKLSKPLSSRLRKLFLPPYTQEQFLQVAVKVLPKKLKEETVHIIASQVWNSSKDVRDLISVGKLIRNNDGPEEVEQVLNTLTKYSGNGGFADILSG